jgi:hypothetical protein
MHQLLGRPMFRPVLIDALGVGAHWAFLGAVAPLRVFDRETKERVEVSDEARRIMCRMQQWMERAILSGPGDAEEDLLMRERYGYRAEATEETGRSRLEWEADFSDLLKSENPSRAELRVWLQAREVTHEWTEILVETFREIGVPLGRLNGGYMKDAKRRREFLTEFFDSLPGIRVAVDMKLGILRDNNRGWDQNSLYDTDAMTFGVPYCHIVVPDKATADAMRRAKAGQRSGTLITSRVGELLEALPDLEARAALLPDPGGWDEVAPGVGFSPISIDDPEVQNLRSELAGTTGA